MRSVTFQEFNEMLRQHELWLEDTENGQQLVARDLLVEGFLFEEVDLSLSEWHDCKLVEVSTDSDFSESVWSGCTIKNSAFGKSKLSMASFRRCKLDESNFDEANLDDATVLECEISNCDFFSITAQRSTWEDCNFKADLFSEFTGADLTGSYWTSSNLTKVSFRDADLTDAKFWHADITMTNLRTDQLSGADFTDAFGEPEFEPPEEALAEATVAGTPLHPLHGSLFNPDFADAIGSDYEDAVVDYERYFLIHNQDPSGRVIIPKHAANDIVRFIAENVDGDHDEWAQVWWEKAFEHDVADKELRFRVADATGFGVMEMVATFLDVDIDRLRSELEDLYVKDVTLTPMRGGGVVLESDNLEELRDAVGVAKKLAPKRQRKPRRAFGRARQAHREVSQMSAPVKVAAFKRTFPAAFELIKHDIRAGTLDPDSARALIDQFGMTWDVDKVTWRPALQRLSPAPNDVLRLNVDLGVVTDDPELLKTIEAIRKTSYQSQHPVRKGGAFTVGWVRYSAFEDKGVLLVEEVQSDLPVVRKGLSDEEFKRQLKAKGMTDTQIRAALDVLEPYAERFYTDALSLVFDLAHEAGLTVEMLSYTQKQAMVEPGERTSPRSVYEKLPKMMGMQKNESQLDFVEGRVWRVKPNPPGRRKALRVPKRFTWSSHG